MPSGAAYIIGQYLGTVVFARSGPAVPALVEGNHLEPFGEHPGQVRPRVGVGRAPGELLARPVSRAAADTAGYQRALLVSAVFIVAAALIATRAPNTWGEPVVDDADALPATEGVTGLTVPDATETL